MVVQELPFDVLLVVEHFFVVLNQSSPELAHIVAHVDHTLSLQLQLVVMLLQLFIDRTERFFKIWHAFNLLCLFSNQLT